MMKFNNIHALSQINRYNGYTDRPYSVLEHTVIGSQALLRANFPDAAREFLLHDLHESVTGDPCPVNIDYYDEEKLRNAQMEFDKALFDRLFDGRRRSKDGMVLCRHMDATMAWVEIETLTVGMDNIKHIGNAKPMEDVFDIEWIEEIIECKDYMGRLSVHKFRGLWKTLLLPEIVDWPENM